MPMQVTNNHAGGISIIAFVVAVTVSMAYYQFVYLPQVNAKPVVSEEVLNPAGITSVSILEGSALPSQTQNFEPKEITANLGETNKVVWTNDDTTAHTVTTDTGYNDPTSGEFDSMATIGLLLPQTEIRVRIHRAWRISLPLRTPSVDDRQGNCGKRKILEIPRK